MKRLLMAKKLKGLGTDIELRKEASDIGKTTSVDMVADVTEVVVEEKVLAQEPYEFLKKAHARAEEREAHTIHVPDINDKVKANRKKEEDNRNARKAYLEGKALRNKVINFIKGGR